MTGLFVEPLVWFARIDKGDFIDGFYTGVARLNELRMARPQSHRDRTPALVRRGDRGRICCLRCGGVVFMILLWLIVVLLAGGVFAWLAARSNPLLCRWISLAAICMDFVLVLGLGVRNFKASHRSCHWHEQLV